MKELRTLRQQHLHLSGHGIKTHIIFACPQGALGILQFCFKTVQ